MKRPTCAAMKDRLPTAKQVAARNRNWSVRRIRGIAASCSVGLFTPGESKAILNVVEEALRRLGAEPEQERRERYRRELHDAIMDSFAERIHQGVGPI